MILLLRNNTSQSEVRQLVQQLRREGVEAKQLQGGQNLALHAPGTSPAQWQGHPAVEQVLAPAKEPLRVCGGKSRQERTRELFGTAGFVTIAGPCAVESQTQMLEIAHQLKELGVSWMRGGAYKPRTRPNSFQGHGEKGLRYLREAADRYDLKVVTEVMEVGTLSLVCEYADLLQVGSRNMQNFPLLKAIGRVNRGVILKRGMAATLDEWLSAAEYIAAGGNERIALCERGLRHFDPTSRNILDLAAVPLLAAKSPLPVLVDPSHGVGVRQAIPPLCRAAWAVGAAGVMVEAHPDPGIAKSDGIQALTPEGLGALVRDLARLQASASQLDEAAQ